MRYGRRVSQGVRSIGSGSILTGTRPVRQTSTDALCRSRDVSHVGSPDAIRSSSLIRALEAAGYAVRDSNGRFELLSAIRRSPNPVMRHLDLALRCLAPVARELEATVSVAGLIGDRIEILPVNTAPGGSGADTGAGRLVPPHASAIGKAITAFQSLEQRAGLLDAFGLYRLTAATTIEVAELEAEFDRVITRGFATEEGEWADNVAGVAVPVFTPGSDCRAAIGVSTIQSQSDGTTVDKHVVDQLQSVAERIATALAERS